MSTATADASLICDATTGNPIVNAAIISVPSTSGNISENNVSDQNSTIINDETWSVAGDKHGRKRLFNTKKDNELINQKKPKILNENLTKNKFAVLATLNNEESSDPMNEAERDRSSQSRQKNPEVNSRPPPIFVNNIANFSDLNKEFAKHIGINKCTFKIANKNSTKITVDTIENYRTIVKILNSHNAEYHTYQIKQERSFRIVIRGLHSSVDTEDIKIALSGEGHVVRAVLNIKNYKTKEALPLFFVDLEPKENNRDIFRLYYILNTKIKVEAPKKQSLVQCIRCQQYGHSHNFCKKSPRCVKCGKDHLTAYCNISRECDPTCALCGGNHPANYKGCSVYLEICKRKNQQSTNRITITDNRVAPLGSNITQYHPVVAEFPPISTTTDNRVAPRVSNIDKFRPVATEFPSITNRSDVKDGRTETVTRHTTGVNSPLQISYAQTVKQPNREEVAEINRDIRNTNERDFLPALQQSLSRLENIFVTSFSKMEAMFNRLLDVFTALIPTLARSK